MFLFKKFKFTLHLNVDVSVTMNQKLCFILQHKVKRIGRFIIEVLQKCKYIKGVVLSYQSTFLALFGTICRGILAAISKKRLKNDQQG